MFKITINDKVIEASKGQNILEISKDNGIHIPHFCYDERIEAYGGCGLCVVEIEGSPKLARACSTKVSENMVITTNTKRTEAARKTALKLLVSDHRGDCRPPCVMACPAHTDIQGYAGLIANGQDEEAIKLIKEQLPLPASIGRVCPHPCETACRRGLVEEAVSIACIKMFPADKDLFEAEKPFMPELAPATGKTVAIVGAGPAGLTAAYFLATYGHNVEIFEMMEKPGGMLRYGIPEYRLPKEVVDKEVDVIKALGVKINYGVKIGTDYSLKDLQSKFDTTFLAIGAWKSSSMRCEGEELDGVLGGIDFLQLVTRGIKVDLGEKVIVVGGGNTAMDVARTAKRLGAHVTVVYRRTEEQMPAEDLEIKEAKEEGVNFKFLVSPVNVIDNGGKAGGVNCQVMELGEADASGRRRPVPIDGKIEVLEADTVIAAIGQNVEIGDIEVGASKWGTIEIDETTYQTNMDGVFAGGDAVTGPKIAIDAIAQGKNAAKVMNTYLAGFVVPHTELISIKQDDITKEKVAHIPVQNREHAVHVSPEIRSTNFKAITNGYTEEQARREASRCLECGCKDYYECQLIECIEDVQIDVDKVTGEKHDRKTPSTHEYIDRNADKCIQCGLCLRACENIVGVGALGLIGRGFDTIVAPAFGLPLELSDCVSCGQCVDICPVGALQEKNSKMKEIPLNLTETAGVCDKCDLSCPMIFEHKGDIIYKVKADKSKGNGVLCNTGKFGFEGSSIKSISVEYKESLLDSVKKADTVVVFGEIYKEFTPLASTIKDIEGKIIVVSDKPTLMDNYACEIYKNSQEDELIKVLSENTSVLMIASEETIVSDSVKDTSDQLILLKKNK